MIALHPVMIGGESWRWGHLGNHVENVTDYYGKPVRGREKMPTLVTEGRPVMGADDSFADKISRGLEKNAIVSQDCKHVGCCRSRRPNRSVEDALDAGPG